MASIAKAAGRIKAGGAAFVTDALVREACDAAGHRFRERLLTPAVTLRLLVLQVLAGNVACRAVSLLGGRAFSPQAYCAARMRLPVDVLGAVAAILTHEARQRVAGFGRWRGRRILHVDGGGLSMPDTPALQLAYGQPQPPGKPGFPVMHVLWLFDAATGLLCDFIASPWNTHDLAHVSELHASMDPGDVLVGDRAFASFAHLALLLQGNLHGLFRLHQRRITHFTPGPGPGPGRSAPTSRRLRSLGKDDQLVAYARPRKRPAWMSEEDFAALPEAITVRELRYAVARPGFRSTSVTLVTTLIDPSEYPSIELAGLYHARWNIETNLRHLKQTMGMGVLRSTTTDGVAKELWACLIVYNRVRLLMLDAAGRQGVAPGRVSFVDALDALRYRSLAAVTLPLIVNPLRPGRCEPRVIKRRKDRYTYLTRPRDELRKLLGIARVAG